MNLNHLRFTRAVAETLSFARAAESCFVTQSTLSAGIAQLERELGGRVFLRTSRRVSLTPFGEQMIPLIRQVLEAESQLLAGAAIGRHPTNELRIGLSPLVDADRVAKASESFARGWSDTNVITFESNLVDLAAALSQGKVDLVITPVDRRLHGPRRTLYHEELTFIPSRERTSHFRRDEVHIDDLAGETLALVTDACGLAATVRELFAARRLPIVEYAGKASSYHLLEEWAARGLSGTLLPRSKVSPAITPRRLTVSSGAPVLISFEMVWREDPGEGTPLAALIDHLDAHL